MLLTFSSSEYLNFYLFSEDVQAFLTIIPTDVANTTYEKHSNTEYLHIKTKTFKITILFYDGVYDHWYLETPDKDNRNMLNHSKEKSITKISEVLQSYEKHLNIISNILK